MPNLPIKNDYILSITLPNNTTYEIVDQGARDMIAELFNINHFVGKTTSTMIEGKGTAGSTDTSAAVTIDGESYTPSAGDVVSDSTGKEWIYGTLSGWVEFAELKGIGKLGWADTVDITNLASSGSYTPAGTITNAAFTGTEATIQPEATYTPAGSVTNAEFTGTEATIEPEATYTPQGTVTSQDLENATVNVLDVSNVTGTPFSVDVNHSLILPGATTASVVTGYDDESSASFSGTEATITSSATYTPAGSVSADFEGTEATITSEATYTPAGSVAADFEGTAATINVSSGAAQNVGTPHEVGGTPTNTPAEP